AALVVGVILLPIIFAVGGVLGRERVEIFFGDALRRKRRRLQRKGLRGRRLLAGYLRLRHRPLLHPEKRLAIGAVEHEKIALLAEFRDARNILAISLDVEKRGRT